MPERDSVLAIASIGSIVRSRAEPRQMPHNDEAEQGLPAADQIEATERKLYDLATVGEAGSGFIDFSSSLTRAVDMAEAAYRRESHITGVTTGFRDLNRRLGGLQKSDLIILAGRPSMG